MSVVLFSDIKKTFKYKWSLDEIVDEDFCQDFSIWMLKLTKFKDWMLCIGTEDDERIVTIADSGYYMPMSGEYPFENFLNVQKVLGTEIILGIMNILRANNIIVLYQSTLNILMTRKML